MDVTVVFHAPDGVDAHRGAIDGYVEQTKSLPGVEGAASPFTSRARSSADGTTAFVRIDIDQTMIGGCGRPDRRAAGAGQGPATRRGAGRVPR